MADATATMNEHALLVGNLFPWHEVYTPDAQKTIAFYSEVFGYGTQSMDMGGGCTYHMLTKDGKSFGGVMDTTSMPEQNIPPHWAVYMSVDDVDARLAKAVELGATVVVPPMDIPSVGRMTLIADPLGAHLWLYKSESA